MPTASTRRWSGTSGPSSTKSWDTAAPSTKRRATASWSSSRTRTRRATRGPRWRRLSASSDERVRSIWRSRTCPSPSSSTSASTRAPRRWARPSSRPLRARAGRTRRLVRSPMWRPGWRRSEREMRSSSDRRPRGGSTAASRSKTWVSGPCATWKSPCTSIASPPDRLRPRSRAELGVPSPDHTDSQPASTTRNEPRDSAGSALRQRAEYMGPGREAPGPAPGAQALPEGKHAEGRGGQRLEQRGDARRRRGHPLESRAEEEVGDGGGDQAEVEQEGPARGERAHDLALQEQDGGEQRRGQREGGGGERQRRRARQKALGGQRVHGGR